MQFNRVCGIHFSPGGTTKKTVETITAGFSGKTEKIDLLVGHHAPIKEFDEKDLVVVGVPVFAGRVPSVIHALLANVKGLNTPAIAVVTYGNRAYENALRELCLLLESLGFIVVGAGAFVCQHSMFPKAAEGRPDEADVAKIKDFARACGAKIEVGPISVAGKVPGGLSKKDTLLAVKPEGNHACIKCGVCVLTCPVKAIPPAKPNTTDKSKCICCLSCVYRCPKNARDLEGVTYNLQNKAYLTMYNKERLEPETFV